MQCRMWGVHGPVQLSGTVKPEGAKNAVLVAMSSLLLTRGTSTIYNVPSLTDVHSMCSFLEQLGAVVTYDVALRCLTVNTVAVGHGTIPESFFEAMQSMRASSLLLGPLLARCGTVRIARTKGCDLGERPLDFHIRAFMAMGAQLRETDPRWLELSAERLRPLICCLEYPSVGTTENIMLAAATVEGETVIDNAAIDPEIIALAGILRAMGAHVSFDTPARVIVRGSAELRPIEHTVPYDRLEAGTFLIGAAVTGGRVTVTDIPAADLTAVLDKLSDMGHHIAIGARGLGVTLSAAESPRAVSFRTMPYPGFPTDLQAPMMVAQVHASLGMSNIMETVFENRMTHVHELVTMGARIDLLNRLEARVHAGTVLRSARICAPNIRGGAALLLAACAARGTTELFGVEHILRGYVDLPGKLNALGALITS